MRQLVLCADDFAFSTEISTTIAELLHAGKLNATGCMTVRPNWPSDSRLLVGMPDHVQIGLHLVLSDEPPLVASSLAPDGSLPAIADLRRLARRGELSREAVAAEVEAQFDRFEQVMGRAPAFVDGHQHAHALPIIRGVVLDTVRRRAPDAWVRVCEDRWQALLVRPFAGKAIGSAYHSRGMRRDAARLGLRCNTGFAGHYDFAGDYAALFPKLLRRPGARHLVMCHPGSGERAGDVIAAARQREASALRQLPVAELAARHGLRFPV